MFQRVAPVLAITAALLIAADGPKSGDLTIHEWGTFTSVAGADGSAIDWDSLSCPEDLPKFVNSYGYRGFKVVLMGTVRMETPVMYFYSPHELTAHVTVRFPHGLITEWYPKAEYSVYQAGFPLPANQSGIDLSLRKPTGVIEWRNIKVQPGTTPVMPVENGPSRYYAARQTDAAPLTVAGEPEKFLFYRGVGRFQIPLAARISGEGKILVENRGAEPVPGVILFENRGGRLGFRNLGTVGGAATLDAPSLDRTFPELQGDLEAVLIEQGLFAKEAHAMVETWRDSWFEEGSRLLYIVPARTVDTILPVEVEPAPAKIARVFVGRIELITPATARAVEQAIARHDAVALGRYSRFLEPILQRIASQEPLTERQKRMEQLLQGVSSLGFASCRQHVWLPQRP
jgi:hypothetical protein